MANKIGKGASYPAQAAVSGKQGGAPGMGNANGGINKLLGPGPISDAHTMGHGGSGHKGNNGKWHGKKAGC